MSDRLPAAIAELAEAILEEVRRELLANVDTSRLLSVNEAAEQLGIGRTALYSEIAAGRLATVKIGRRRLVPASSVEARIYRGLR